jgi:hypoxia up-regulated 1
LASVAFKPIKGAAEGSFPERLYGSDADALSARFPGDVYPNLKAILALPLLDPRVVDYTERHPALRAEAEKHRGTLQYYSNAFGKEESPFMIEELLAMELQSIQRNAEALAGGVTSIKDVVITIPPYYIAEEKRAIRLATDLAGLRIVQFVSDGLAVGINYATLRTFPSVSEGAKPEYHMVFDMGAGSTKATVLKFQGRTVKDALKRNKTIQEVEVVGSGWDRSLGGDALNSIIVDDMLKHFTETKAAKKGSITIDQVANHGRAMASLSKQAEKTRHILSANAESQASFESLYNDIDFKYKIKRSNFEKLAQGHADRIAPVVKQALDAARLSVSDIESVILHGGAVRTPFVQKVLEKTVGSADKLRTNVNADEAAVFGAAFKGAALSPGYRVKDIRTYDSAFYPVSMKWTNINLKPQKQRLYTAQSHLGAEKIVSFQNLEDFDIHFYQDLDGATEAEFAHVTTKNLTATVSALKEAHGCANADIISKFTIRLSPEDGEIEIVAAAVQCEVEHQKGGVAGGIKNLLGLGKKDHQEVLAESEIVSDAEAEPSTTSESEQVESPTSSSAASSSSMEPEAAAPKGKRTVSINIDIDVKRSGLPALPKEIARAKRDRLNAFDASDKARKQRDEAHNTLEAYCYRVKDRVENEDFIKASTEGERQKLLKLAEDASEWIYGEGHDAARDVLRDKLNELKSIVLPIERRKTEAISRPKMIKALEEAIVDVKYAIGEARKQLNKYAEELASWSASQTATGEVAEPSQAASASDDFADLEDAETASSSTSTAPSKATNPPDAQYQETEVVAVEEAVKQVESWFTAKLAEQESLQSHEDPVLLADDLDVQAKQLRQLASDMAMKAMRQAKQEKMKPKRSKKTKTSKAKSSATVTPEETPTVAVEENAGASPENQAKPSHKIDEL